MKLNSKKLLKVSSGLLIFSFALFLLRKVDFLISFLSPLFSSIFNPLLIFISLIIALCIELAYLFYLLLRKKELVRGIILKPLLVFLFFMAIFFIESQVNIAMFTFSPNFLSVLKEDFYPEAENFKSLFSPYTIPGNDEIWKGVYNLASIQTLLFNYDGEVLSGTYGRAYLIQAQSKIGMGEYDEAEYYLKRYSPCDFYKTLTCLYQAKLLYHKGKLKEAILNAKKSIDFSEKVRIKSRSKALKDISQKFYLYYRAAELAKKGDFDSCTKLLKKYLSSKEVYPDLYILERLSSDPNFKEYVQSTEFIELRKLVKSRFHRVRWEKNNGSL